MTFTFALKKKKNTHIYRHVIDDESNRCKHFWHVFPYRVRFLFLSLFACWFLKLVNSDSQSSFPPFCFFSHPLQGRKVATQIQAKWRRAAHVVPLAFFLLLVLLVIAAQPQQYRLT